jgi:uncharacterized protein YecT (DUF1311 family)
VVAAAEAGQREQFLAILQHFEVGGYPSHTAAEQRAADVALNAAYRRALERLKSGGSTVTQDQVREAERAWLAYRAAWLALIGLRYQAAPRAAADTWLLSLRTAQLEEL